ncbi:MAG: DUF2752 domain-containing protein [Actinomycetota bacterium]|nr:DUF2752 domain-containing protein [Actinomycetota bacterium]
MSLTWRHRDEWAWLTAAAVVLVMGAVTLAFVGLPTFSVHSPLHYAGIMDPLCGMTRAVRLLALGRFDDAWAFNPASFALLIVVGALLVRALVGGVTHMWAHLEVKAKPHLAVALIVLTAALWVNQQSHASLLMS